MPEARVSKPPTTTEQRSPSPSGAVSASPNFPKNETKKERAAILLAEDELSDEVIANTIGVTRRTLTNWKQQPDFNALVGDYHGRIVAQALKLPIANKTKRVTALNTLHEKQWQAIHARAERCIKAYHEAESPENATRRFFGDTVPAEAMTGLFVREESVNASGMKTVNWKYDSALSKDIKDTEKQAAQELGQWEDKAALDVSGGMQIQIVGMSEEELP